MKKIKPSITCIIATRNRIDVIDRAIKSVLDQTYLSTRILIIDDNSSDGTVEYLKSRYAKHSEIAIFQNEMQLGPAATRNKGLDLANSDYVCFLDDDDEWRRDKLKRQMALASQGYDFITMTRAVYVLDGHEVFQYGPKMKKVTLHDLFRRNVVISVSPLIKTSLFRRIRFNTRMWCGEDYEAWIRILKDGANSINLNDPLIVLHKNSGSSLNKIRKNKFLGRKQVYNKHKGLMNLKEKMLFHLMTILKLIVPDPRYYQKRIQQSIRNIR